MQFVNLQVFLEVVAVKSVSLICVFNNPIQVSKVCTIMFWLNVNYGIQLIANSITLYSKVHFYLRTSINYLQIQSRIIDTFALFSR